MSEVAQAPHSSPDGRIPQLRFPEFDGVWESRLLKDAVKINPRSGELPDEFIYIDLESVKKGYLIKETQINKIGAPSRAQRLLNKNDVIFQTVRPYQKNNYFFNLDGDYVASTGYAQLRVLNSPEFLYQALHTDRFVYDVMARSTGTSYPAINSTDLSKIKLNLPTKPEQQKIATFLIAVDNKIEQLSKKQELLGEYKKGAMQQIFSQATRFKADDGSNFPDWEEVKLGNLTHKVGKKNKENIKYPIYSINNQEGFRPQSEQFDGLDSNDRGYDISLYKIVNEKTFAYNPARINVGSIGYSYNLNKVIVSSLYVCFKTNDELEDLYLLAYLDTDKFNKDILRYEEGGVRQYLFYENFSQISIPLPGNDEQAKISNFLSSIDNKIEQVDKQLDESKQFKKALLQQMFV